MVYYLPYFWHGARDGGLCPNAADRQSGRPDQSSGRSARSSSDTRPRSKDSHSSATGGREPIAIARAVDWIEAQLKSYGCPNTERVRYEYQHTAALRRDSACGASGRHPTLQGGGRPRGVRIPHRREHDPMKQPDEKLRALNMRSPRPPGPREEVYCTKIGTTHPEEMYIVGGHMDGHGYGEAANDDGSGTALVMELARVFSSPDVQTERSIRFALWNNEETGLNGARAYVEPAPGAAGQGRLRPDPGSIPSRNGSA